MARSSWSDVVALILAGGEGKRLYPLTRDRAKPAVPFGGRYRIIDFVLSNFVNSGISKISVLTQYKAGSFPAAAMINDSARSAAKPTSSYIGSGFSPCAT